MADEAVKDAMGCQPLAEVAVIGSGLMGHGIAQVFAQKDYSVTLYDLNPFILEKALSRIRSNLETFVEVGLEPEERMEKILSRIETSIDLGQAVEKACFVVEAAPEDLALKIQLFEELDRNCPAETILASNTSTLPISEFGKKVKRRERLIITHWFNPPHIIPVVEVVRGEMTSARAFDLTFDLMKRLGKRPIRVLKEIPGFLINRVQTAMVREILSLIEQGVAEPEDIDAGVRGSFGLRLAVQGPLRTGDMGGLDLWFKGMRYLYPSLDRSTNVQRVLEEKIERGELGLKTGKGFFQYDEEEALTRSGQTRERDKRLLSLLRTLTP
jgi:3-hydroxybutyryl-CoA dehydrogenase